MCEDASGPRHRPAPEPAPVTISRFAPGLFVALLATAPGTAAADDAAEAEKVRLEQEMKRYAARNAWGGVARAYEELIALRDIEIPYEDHLLGFQAARNIGDTLGAYERLLGARAVESTDEVEREIGAIDSAFGRVEIIGHPRRRPRLARPAMPFAPDQRKSVEFAKSVVEESGSFRGMIPAGDYLVGDLSFTVVAGPDWQVIDVKKGSAGGADAPAEAAENAGAGFQGPDGAVVYWGPVATIGPALGWSPEPPSGDDIQPASVLGSGFQAQAGVEIGFTRHFAIAPTIAFQGNYTVLVTSSQVTGWLGLVLRPGDARFALGPTFGAVFQNGTGVAAWTDRSQDGDVRATENLTYTGFAWGPGAAFSAGYGVLDLEPLQGTIELQAQWQEGPRRFLGAGIRVGIVPKVPRFER